MKTISTIAIVSLCLFGCHHKSKTLPEPEPEFAFTGPGGDYYGDENISRPVPAINTDRLIYGSSIDTFYVTTFPVFYYTGALLDEGDSAIVSIEIVGQGTISKREYFRAWYPEAKKFAAVHTLLFDYKKPLDCIVKATTRLQKSGFQKTTELPVKMNITKKLVDLFGVNFGMSKAEVKENEKTRLGSWAMLVDRDSNLVTLGSEMFYEFEQNKLTHVSQRIYEPADFLERIKYLGYPYEEIRNEPVSWSSHKLVFEVTYLNYPFSNPPQNFLVLKYSPKK